MAFSIFALYLKKFNSNLNLQFRAISKHISDKTPPSPLPQYIIKKELFARNEWNHYKCLQFDVPKCSQLERRHWPEINLSSSRPVVQFFEEDVVDLDEDKLAPSTCLARITQCSRFRSIFSRSRGINELGAPHLRYTTLGRATVLLFYTLCIVLPKYGQIRIKVRVTTDFFLY